MEPQEYINDNKQKHTTAILFKAQKPPLKTAEAFILLLISVNDCFSFRAV